ncbi:MAG: hypothetical protein LBI67_00910 [Treponema sp.]|jgi:hypothetical protein|nr:hypothetical protein [Treponema sp.]
MAEWTISPERMAGVPKEMINDVRKVYAFDIFNNVVARTPVHNDDYTKHGKKRKKQYLGGATRQNWLVTLNSEDHSFDPSKHKGQHGKAKGEKVIDSAKGDDTIFIQNNAPNINMLEYGGWPKLPKNGSYTDKGESKTVNGFSREAPNGMIGVTMAKAQQLFEKAVNTVKSWK